jgi:MscS family membrane protein
MLRDHPRVETSTAWIRLAKLADSALELEMQAYVLTRDYDDYSAVREDLLLRVMDIVESCGTALSSPSQTVYLERVPKAAEQKTESIPKG